ncbi:TPA: hypothetical protein DIV49_03940 [Candidatus Saccharibacteria bacterium]|nr:hypothetical protein [Candidatus Saccharibacteria bacterium]HRF28097.1 PrgI family protein [Candidatus Saccharibacteria bacterium]HRJ90664.1 PrgI family protein [Candidatus Saccharibacteria bacterium]
MAVYKVPQDVEADDKLIGPFSFRQFIYLLIVAASIAVGWGLSRLFIPLAIIPLPLVIFFGALALPLRKDQPMETYMAAIVAFYLKPRKRLWDPDGTQFLVEITAPKVVEVQRTKDLSETEAEQRISYLADIVDTRGWAVRGVDANQPNVNSALNSDVFTEAQATTDILDDSNDVGRSLDAKLDEATKQRHEAMLQRVQNPQPQQPVQVADPYASLPVTPAPVATVAPANDPSIPQTPVSYNPYPSQMHQSVIQPIDPNTPAPTARPTNTDTTTSEKPVSPDIINLANNPDLSVETIAREAHRIEKKHQLPEDEVVISLR